MALRLQVVLLLCGTLCHFCEGNRGDDGAGDCCLEVSPRVIPRRIVADYEVQDGGTSCRIAAVIFITVKGRKLCAPPASRWVKRLMRRCDKLNQPSGLDI
ncbi:C-C motif chemokine 19-like [Heptranchias perlo]|uniref:C-C motif chemokine 19-like n=1 Tax=Heptranchias perlo TaxID=212740 RepID=UPI0035598A81